MNEKPTPNDPVDCCVERLPRETGWADIFADENGKRWTVVVGHSTEGVSVELERRHNLLSQWHAEQAMERLYGRHFMPPIS